MMVQMDSAHAPACPRPPHLAEPMLPASVQHREHDTDEVPQDATVEAFRRLHPHDDALVGVPAWASFAAARRIGSWLAVPPAHPPVPVESLAVLGGEPAL